MALARLCLILAALFVSAGCSTCQGEQGADGAKVGATDPGRLASAEVDAPAGCAWKRAAVRVTETRTRGRHPQHVCRHSLWLDDGTGFKLAKTLFTFRGGIGPAELGAKYAIDFAPDGHALAVSTDGAEWTYVGLDAGKHPTHCRHQSFAGKAGDGSIWNNAPTTRALALDILTDHRNARHGSYMTELDDSFHYAQEHPDDAELWSAVDELFLARKNRKLAGDFNRTIKEQLATAVADLAARDSDLKDRLVAAAGSGGPDRELRDRAFIALSRFDDADTQLAVAIAIGSDASRFPPPEAPLWALAYMTAQRGKAPPVVFEVLSNAAAVGGKSNCFGSAWAIRGLAALDTPEAWAQIEAAARAGCDYERDLPDKLPPWEDFRSDKTQKAGKSTWLHEAQSTWVLEASCWAALALRRR